MNEQLALELPEFTKNRLKPDEIGFVEAATRRAIDDLRAGGWLTAAHSHLAALAVAAAHDFDHAERSKAYGIAQMTQAVAKVFEMLPLPEQQKDDAFDRLLADLATAEEETPA